MPDYQKSKIYKITNPACELPYIGSTTVSLSKRLGQHRYNSKNNMNRCMSRQLFITDGATIELIEIFPCESSTQLLRREGEIIRSMPCINKQISGRTPAEYRADNHDRHLAYNAKYRQTHHDKINAYLKTKHSCECGSTYTNRDKARHFRTRRHINYIDSVRGLKDRDGGLKDREGGLKEPDQIENVALEQNEPSTE